MRTLSAILLTLSLSLIGLLLPHFNKIFAAEYIAYILIIECIALLWYTAYVGYGWRKRGKTFMQSHIAGVSPIVIASVWGIFADFGNRPTQSGFLFEVPFVREIMQGSLNYIYYILFPVTEYLYPIDNIGFLYYTVAIIVTMLVFMLGYKSKF